MPAPIDAIVDAYNPQGTREIAQIAKAADMDIAARVVCRMIQAPGRSVEEILTPTQSVLTSDRAARQPIAAVERRTTRTAKQAVAAVSHTTRQTGPQPRAASDLGPLSERARPTAGAPRGGFQKSRAQ